LIKISKIDVTFRFLLEVIKKLPNIFVFKPRFLEKFFNLEFGGTWNVGKNYQRNFRKMSQKLVILNNLLTNNTYREIFCHDISASVLNLLMANKIVHCIACLYVQNLFRC